METVFRCFYNDDKFLAHLWTNFESELFLEFLRDWVFYEPAIKFGFRVLDFCTILVVKRQLVSIVLSKYCITFELSLTRNAHIYDLVFITYVGQKKRRTQNFPTNELAIVDNIRIDVKDLINICHVLLLLSLCFDFVLVIITCCKK